MAERGADARTLDVAAFCRQGSQLESAWPLADLPRLAGSLSAVPAGAVQWSAHGSVAALPGAAPQACLQLQARARVPLQCQRCLQPLDEPLVVDRRFRFVHGETLAAQLDEDSDDDVLALPQRLDLRELLEDELILALPLVPRHAVCPQPLPLVADGANPPGDGIAPNPFAALAALRGRPPH